jgi:anti-anti-sigma regulatory factor
MVDFSGLTMAEPLESAASLILSSALALAVIASIDALLCAKLASPPGELRAGDDGLLIRLGIANMVSASFGGITSGINIGPSLANRAFGGRSWLSVIVNAAAVLAGTLLFPILAYMPRAVLSAVIMVVAIQHIDPWTRQFAARLIKPGTPQRGAIALDLGVSLFVSLLSIAINVVLAVFIGIMLAVLLFVIRMSRSNIRRLYRCDAVRSRRYRDPAEMEVLHAQGASVLVIELQGALFFGTADRLAQIVDSETVNRTTALLLDLRRITEIDSTGARILGDIDAALGARGVKLALVLSGRTETAARLGDIFQPRDRFFPDIDRAIEWAEDNLLQRAAPGPPVELSLELLPLLRDFTADQIERLRNWLEPVAWSAGDVIFGHGDPGSSLYLVTRGRASVHLRHDDGSIRLVTFAAGAVFGELALLDRGPRSATVTADEDLSGFGLSEASFSIVCREQPDIAIKLLSSLGRELSVRIRYANMTIQQLES